MLGSFYLVAAGWLVALPALADEGTLVNVDSRTVFAPIGFDDNDEAEVVVEGFLPADCYRITAPDVALDLETKQVVVKSMARKFDVPCVEILVPFHYTVRLGLLEAGEYQIIVPGPEVTLNERLPVKIAVRPGPDDFPYVPVDSVEVNLDRVEHHMVATVRGRFTNTCMRWAEARVEDNGKTVNLLPIMALDALDHCDSVETAYEQKVVLPDSIRWGRHLLHVRTLNGQAVNHIFFKL